MAATTMAFPSPLELSAHTKMHGTLIYNANINRTNRTVRGSNKVKNFLHTCCLCTCIVCAVERLYCKRPIQCLASSKTLTPHPPPPGECLPPAFGEGRTHSLGGKGGWGVNILEDVRHSSVLYSTYVSTLWSVLVTGKQQDV